jgi:hypothetical protein
MDWETVNIRHLTYLSLPQYDVMVNDEINRTDLALVFPRLRSSICNARRIRAVGEEHGCSVGTSL